MQIILTAIDNNPHYQEHLKAFLMSLRLNSPGARVRVCFMNCTSEYVNSVRKIYDIEIVRTSTPKEKTARQRNYVRHHMFKTAFKDGYESVAWIDNDTLIRFPLKEIWDNATGSIIKVWSRSGKKDSNKFQTGVYILGNTALTQDYVREICKRLKDADDWKLPQELIYTLHQEFYLSHIQLKECYNDSRFRDKSVIWHCKQSHFKEKKFQKEFKFYLKKANKLCRSSLS